MTRFSLGAAPFAALVAVPSISPAQNIVTNPGFELGANHVGGRSFNTPANIQGWSIDDGGAYPPGCEDDEGIDYSFNRRSGNYGLQFSEFGCINGISQSLATMIGQTYDIDFYVRNAGVSSAAFFSATFGTNTIFTGPLAPSVTYQHFFGTFAATSAFTTLEFLSDNDDSYTFLDDISVVAAPADVETTPEPQSLALLAAGFAVMFPVVRRKK